MNNRDRMRQYDTSLHVHFGSTGERRAVTALSLNDSLQVRLDGKRLLWSNSAKGKIMSACLKSSDLKLWLVMLLKQCNMRLTASHGAV